MRAVGIFVLWLGNLAFSGESSADSTLQTQRSAQLERLLREAAELPHPMLLAERNAKLSALRNQYEKTLEQPDFAAEIYAAGISSVLASNSTAMGFRLGLKTIFQFNANWQLDAAWHAGQRLSVHPTILRESPSEIPTLEHLVLGYGRERSVETRAGLLNDEPLLPGQKAQPMFSGLNVTIHPLVQRHTPQEPVYRFEMEHGWSLLRQNLQAQTLFGQIQRTRPQLSMNWDRDSWGMHMLTALEWYSDNDKLLNRVVAQRSSPDPTLAFPKSLDESRFRLFALAWMGRWNVRSDFGLRLSAHRVSNTIGRSAQPAWSVNPRAQHTLAMPSGTFKSQLGLHVYNVPAGSVPMMRLPLEINPGSHGHSTSFELHWEPLSLKNQTFTLEWMRLQEVALAADTPLHCSRGAPATPSRPDSRHPDCVVQSINLAWSLKLPTNL